MTHRQWSARTFEVTVNLAEKLGTFNWFPFIYHCLFIQLSWIHCREKIIHSFRNWRAPEAHLFCLFVCLFVCLFLLVLMLCAPSNLRRLSREKNRHKLRKMHWTWQVATVRSINHNVGGPKRVKLLDVNINTGAQSINSERASLKKNRSILWPEGSFSLDLCPCLYSVSERQLGCGDPNFLNPRNWEDCTQAVKDYRLQSSFPSVFSTK